MINEKPFRYVFDVAGQIEVIANSLEEAKEKAGTKAVTFVVDNKFVLVIPVLHRLIHSEQI